jgi:hypothetical protein
MAARRRANSSFAPVGFLPMAKRPHSESRRSARPMSAPSSFVGSPSVVFEHGQRDVLRLASVERVLAAHHPLQLGELAHHARLEIALGEEGRALDGGRVALPCRLREEHGQRRHAVALLGHRTQALHPVAARELRSAVLQRGLAIFVEEEAPVGQPRAQDALVALHRQGLVLHRGVRHGDETRQHLAACVGEREVALVALHLLDEDLGWQVEVALLEGAHHGVGQLDEVEHLIDQGLVTEEGAVGLLRGGGQAFDQQRAALLERGHHVGLLERGLVAGGRVEGDPPIRQEAVPAGLPAALHVREHDRHHLGAEERDDPLERAAERGLDVAPAHRLGELELLDTGVQNVGQQLDRPPALLFHVGRQVLALRRRHALQLLDGQLHRLGELDRRHLRLAVGLEGRLHGRALHFLHHVVGLLDQPVHQQREAAGRAEAANGAVAHPRGGALLLEEALELVEGGDDEAGRQLFAAELEEQLSHGRPPSRPSSKGSPCSSTPRPSCPRAGAAARPPSRPSCTAGSPGAPASAGSPPRTAARCHARA